MALGDNDPELARYLDAVRIAQHAWEQKRKAHREKWRTSVPLPAYEELKRLIELPKGEEGLQKPRQWAEEMPDEMTRRLWQDMQAETDPTRLRRYLRLVRYLPDVPDVAPLLALMQHSDKHVARDALNALEGITNPALRAEGLRLGNDVGDCTRAETSIKLLISNSGNGDFERIEAAVRAAAEQGQPELHCVQSAALDYFDANPAPQQNRTLLFLYENVACTFCRPYIVDMLLQRGALPGWLRAEAIFDASLETRSIAAGEGWPKRSAEV